MSIEPTAAATLTTAEILASQASQELADAIFADLESAADATDAEQAVKAMSRALAGILRIDDQDQVPRGTVAEILKPFWCAQAASRQALPAWYWHDRGWNGHVCAYSVLMAWAEQPGSKKRIETCHPGMVLFLRIVVNDLDSLVAAYALQRVSSTFRPLSRARSSSRRWRPSPRAGAWPAPRPRPSGAWSTRRSSTPRPRRSCCARTTRPTVPSWPAAPRAGSATRPGRSSTPSMATTRIRFTRP